MNKELILKYKNEFDHWLNGGEILTYNNHHGIWHRLHPDNKWDFTKDLQEDEEYNSYGYVINDEYVEFRKALAEGKTIQIAGLNPIAHPHAHKNTWEDMQGTVFNKAIELYRIKPEEPKFKIGDWIRQGDYVIKVYRIDSDYYYAKGNGCIAIDKAEKWEPRRGQLCWFWAPAEKLLPKLGKFLQMDVHNQYYASFGSGDYSCESHLYCEPFMVALPEYIKELKL